MYAHPSIIIHLKLFNICTHGFVPDAFGVGITVPVIKDRLGDITCSSNYRPITLKVHRPTLDIALFVVNHHRRSAQVWHVFSRVFF